MTAFYLGHELHGMAWHGMGGIDCYLAHHSGIMECYGAKVLFDTDGG